MILTARLSGGKGTGMRTASARARLETTATSDGRKVRRQGISSQVTSVRSYPKAQFPTLAVYGPVPYAELRLITCGGSFDFATGHYLSNTIVYASLVQ